MGLLPNLVKEAGWNLLTNLPNLRIKLLGCEPYWPTDVPTY